MLFSLVKALALSGVLVLAWVTMVVITKLAGPSWGCFMAIVVLVAGAIGSFLLLNAWIFGVL